MFEIRKKITLELIVSIVLIYNSIYIELIIGINSIDRINLALIKMHPGNNYSNRINL